MGDYVLRPGGRILLILVLAIVAVKLLERALNPLVRVAIREQMEGQPEIEVAKRIATLSRVTYTTFTVIVAILVAIMLMSEVGIDATALIAGLGLFGLAVGFGAQNLVKDAINGMFILVENQYSVGDVVTIAGIIGVVEDINLRRTVLRDLDGTVHFVGHAQIDVTSNWTKSYSRVNLNVRVSYNADLEHAIEVVNRVGRELAEDPDYKARIIDPPHVLRVDNLGESSVELKVIGDTAPIEQWDIMGELRLRLKKAFDEEGIDIPFPQRTVHTVPNRPLPANGSSPSQPAETAVSGGGEPGDVKLDD